MTVSSLHDSPNPSNGPHTYSDGSSVTCNVTSPGTEGSTVWICTGWSGSGSVPSSGGGSSVTFNITQNSTITWNWQGAPVQWKLTVSSAHDSPNPTAGDHFYNDSSSVTCARGARAAPSILPANRSSLNFAIAVAKTSFILVSKSSFSASCQI